MIDPSKMDPKVLMELSQLVQQLPPAQLNRMQSLMHNAMAGFDVRKDMEEFERSLPPGFREKLVGLVGQSGISVPPMPQPQAPATPEPEPAPATSADMDLRQARMTILTAVADGRMSPEEAEKLLFSDAGRAG